MNVPERVSSTDRVLLALVAITVVALSLRLYDLGGRVAHWDEARVAYDAMRYLRTGVWQFRPVVHGPFLPKVNHQVFDLLGASDTTMRLVVAVIGGLAPLAAWLFRRHLRREELVILGLLLAANPVLLYYSRFYRNDVALGVVMLVAFGMFVRAYDTKRPFYLYPAFALVALGWTMKGNALLYPVVWIGAVAVLADQYAVMHHDGDGGAVGYLRRQIHSSASIILAWRWHLIGSTLLGLLVIITFYLPRDGETVTLTEVLFAPWRLPELLDVTLVDSTQRMLSHWFAASGETPYLSFLEHYIETLLAGASVVLVFAIIGFIADRYRPGQARALVTIAALWGFVSIVGYPIAADIRAPWLTVHAIIPLTIPAAVGLGFMYRTAIGNLRDIDTPSGDSLVVGGIAALVLLLAVVAVIYPALTLVYLQPTDADNQLAQYAQPGGDWGDTIEDMLALAETNDEGVDVLYAGDTFFMLDEDDAYLKPASGGWYNRLPLPWYFEQVDATTASAADRSTVAELIEEERPPIVIAAQSDRHLVIDHVEGYESRFHTLRLWDMHIDIYLDIDRLDEANP